MLSCLLFIWPDYYIEKYLFNEINRGTIEIYLYLLLLFVEKKLRKNALFLNKLYSRFYDSCKLLMLQNCLSVKIAEIQIQHRR
jgi:hypothetical protein